MAVNQFYVVKYANEIYVNGARSFAGHNGTQTTPPEYHEPCKQYAAANYSKQNILDVALGQNRVTTDEYNQTLAYRTASSPA